MDVIETPEKLQDPFPQPGITLNTAAQYFLSTAGKWASFIAIVGFVGCGLLLLVALAIPAIMTYVVSVSPIPLFGAAEAIIGYVISGFYIIFDVIFFFFCLYLYQFGSRAQRGITFADEIKLTSAIEKLKSFFKLWGILTIVLIVLQIIALFTPVLIGSLFKHSQGL